MTTLLAAQDLTCGYRPYRAVLSAVSLTVVSGGTTVLVGPSGCGKTTLLKTLLGLIPPLAGHAKVLDATLPARPIAGGVGYVPQRLGLVDHASVLQNVLAGMLPEIGHLRSLVGAFRREHVQRAREVLDRLGLAAETDALPLHLSGGQRRRVAIARALTQRPALLVADEILSELDDATAERVLGAVQGLQQERGMGVLMVEHNLDRSCALADVLCCVGDGSLLTTLRPGPHLIEHARKAVARRGTDSAS